MSLNIPEFYGLKGSNMLRSRHMNYSRNVLNNDWHCARESEPKEYNISRGGVRNMHWSTYRRLANLTDGSLPKSTYQDHFNSITLKPYYSALTRDKPMVNVETFRNTYIDRYTGDPKEGYGAVLPRHYPDYVKHSLHMRPNPGFDPFEPEPALSRDFPDKSAAYRKCHSQFTDKDDYRRPGWNTFYDESGIYANTHFKRQVFVHRNPIPNHNIYSQEEPLKANMPFVKREIFQPRRPIPKGSAPEQYDANKPHKRVEGVPRNPILQVPDSVDGKPVSKSPEHASQQYSSTHTQREVFTDGKPCAQNLSSPKEQFKRELATEGNRFAQDASAPHEEYFRREVVTDGNRFSQDAPASQEYFRREVFTDGNNFSQNTPASQEQYFRREVVSDGNRFSQDAPASQEQYFRREVVSDGNRLSQDAPVSQEQYFRREVFTDGNSFSQDTPASQEQPFRREAASDWNRFSQDTPASQEQYFRREVVTDGNRFSQGAPDSQEQFFRQEVVTDGNRCSQGAPKSQEQYFTREVVSDGRCFAHDSPASQEQYFRRDVVSSGTSFPQDAAPGGQENYLNF